MASSARASAWGNALELDEVAHGMLVGERRKRSDVGGAAGGDEILCEGETCDAVDEEDGDRCSSSTIAFASASSAGELFVDENGGTFV